MIGDATMPSAGADRKSTTPLWSAPVLVDLGSVVESALNSLPVGADGFAGEDQGSL